MIVETSEIDWDSEDSSLPQVVTLTVEGEEDIVDALSDRFGYCIKSLSYEVKHSTAPVVMDV
jgi:hypothetical protein